MRDLIRKILEGYKSLKLEGQDEGYVLFSAKEPDSQQVVSIKILPRLLGQDPKIASRFEGLARTIRQLNHPNIPSVRKVGEEAGLPYLVTRVIEKGQPLAAKLDQPWAVDTAADVVMQVGQALEHAYNKGIVHGGLTADNVVIQDDGRVFVTDFGLNELMQLVGGQAQQAVSDYVAPERMAGTVADARSDVYSLAALLYSMLTKRSPQVVKGEVLPPSRFNPDVPQRMDDAIVKALAPEAADRYPDVKTFLAALGSTVLVPAKEEARGATPDRRCPRCGAGNQAGRFCRKCGLRLDAPKKAPSVASPVEKSVLDEPIQVSSVEVGHVEVGKGVDLTDTRIAQPLIVAAGELAADFPEPPEVPRFDIQALWPSMDDQPLIAMPEPPAMPVIDWAEIAPPMPEVPSIEDIPVSEDSD